jgi:HSP20 family protein
MALLPWRGRERGGLMEMQDRINRMFDEFFPGFSPAPWAEERMEWLPLVDVSETDDAVRVTAELPGVQAKDVDISLTEDLLTVRGEKKSEKEEKKRDYHRVERSYGLFTRTVRLPAAVDADKVEATFKDGVLTITMPKQEEAKTRKVKVEVK